jgi:hypothetical protein
MVLGLAYLAKAAMFPLSFVFLAVSLFCRGKLRRALPGVRLPSLSFSCSVLPFVASISMAKGRLTFGDAGTLTYVRYVNGVPYPHWQGETAGSGTPNILRADLDDPPIYEFGTPIGGTYPSAMTLPTGMKELSPRRRGAAGVVVLTSALFYFDLFLRQQGAVGVAVLILYWMGRAGGSRW